MLNIQVREIGSFHLDTLALSLKNVHPFLYIILYRPYTAYINTFNIQSRVMDSEKSNFEKTLHISSLGPKLNWNTRYIPFSSPSSIICFRIWNASGLLRVPVFTLDITTNSPCWSWNSGRWGKPSSECMFSLNREIQRSYICKPCNLMEMSIFTIPQRDTSSF